MTDWCPRCGHVINHDHSCQCYQVEGGAMTEAKSNKELIAIARYDETTFIEEQVDPDDLVEQLADRLEAAEEQIVELKEALSDSTITLYEQHSEIAELKRLVMKLYYCISPSALTCELSADDSIAINKIVGEL